jgi:hypothetical protein
MITIAAVILLKLYAGIGFWLFVTSKHDIEGASDMAVVMRGVAYSFTWPWRKR